MATEELFRAKHFMGIDIGTESVRAGLFTTAGALVGTASQKISVWSDGQLRFEQSSVEIWEAICAATRDLLKESGKAKESVAAVGFGATCSLAVFDALGQPLAVSDGQEGQLMDSEREHPNPNSLRNVILWMDHRAEDQAARINATGNEVLRFVGGKISPEMQTPKLLWLKEHMPSTFDNAAHFFDLADFATWRATGSTERSLCTLICKWTYLANEGRFSPDFFQQIGLGQLADEQFARIGQKVRQVGEPIGNGLTAEAAAELGLLPGIPVAASLIDAHAGTLGTLCPQLGPLERQWALVLGTSACTMQLLPKPLEISGLWGPYLSAVWPGLWLSEGGISAFGFALVQALRMHPHFVRIAPDEGEALAILEKLAGQPCTASTRHSPELHISLEFLGNRSPHSDPSSTAAFVGLRPEGDEEGLVQWFLAVLASLCYGIREIMEHIQIVSGHCFEWIIVSGGMAKNQVLLQMLADVTGCPIRRSVCPEPVLLGAALLGAVASGCFCSIEDASRAMVCRWTANGQETRPQINPEVRAFHDRKFKAYKMLKEFERKLRTI